MTPEYDAWNAALAARFLQERTGEPLYLYTDESVLEEVAGQVGVDAADALAGFVAAVRGTLGGIEPFRSWSIRAARPMGRDEVPAWLAVLCFLVLVAVERESTRFQYYPELNSHLGRPVDSGAPLGFAEHVPSLFRRFNEWLRSDGAQHGTPTARSHEHFPHIGWPLSQAIVRPVDRALLVRLFVSEQLAPGQERSGAWLRAKLVPRLHTATSSPSRTRLLDLNQHHGDVFEDVLLQEYAAWDGRAAAAVGPRRVLLRLCFDEAAGEWWLLCPRVEGTERKRWEVGTRSGTVPPFKGLEAVLPEHELWRLLGGGDIGRVEDGPILTSRRARLRWLSVDTRAGAWAEVGRRDPALPHLVLVAVGDQAPFAGVPGLEVLQDAPPGHQLMLVPAGTEILEDGSSPTSAPARLEGGLCLSHSTSSYLAVASGPPDARPATAALVDGKQVAVVDGVASLRGTALGAGDHVVEVDEHRLHLRVVERLQHGPASPAAPCWLDEVPAAPRMRLPWEAGSIWLVGERGELEQRPVMAPAWAVGLGLSISELDLTSTVRSTWFEPSFVIAHSFRGKPWVQPVPEGVGVAQPAELPRPINRAAARELISRLLLGYGPEARHSDARWKRAYAAIMRTAHL